MSTMRRRLLSCSVSAILQVSLAAVLMCGGFYAGSADAGEQIQAYSFDLPAQDLGAALRAFARVSRQQVVFEDEAVQGKHAPALHGTYTADGALEALLQGSGLRARKGETGLFIIHSGMDAPEAQSGPHPPAAAPDTRGAVQLERVMVTGSNIRTLTAAEEGAAPVAVITQQDLQLLGYNDIKDALRFDSSMTGWSEAEGYLSTRSTVNMRGLGDQYTLVLLNGRRFSAEQAADISLIPISAVERIELLKDGASALYGSDAVGGVVNIITKTRFEGVEVEIYHGNTADTDVSNNQLRLLFGGGNDRLKFLGTLAYTKRNGLYSEDRELTRTQDMRRWGGFDARSGATNPAAFFVPGRGLVRLDTSRFGVGSYSNNPDDYVPYDAEADKWSRPYRSLFMPLERTSFFGSVESSPFDGEFKLFGEMLYSDSKSSYQYGTSVVNFSDPTLGPIPATNPYNPFGIDISQMSYRTYAPLVGAVAGLNVLDTRAMRLTGGFRGWWRDWSYEGAASHFKEEVEEIKRSGWSKRGLREALNRPGANAFNPFCYGCNTAEQLSGVLIAVSAKGEFTLRALDFRTSGAMFDNWAGTVSAAVGAEYREESYQITPDTTMASGDVLDSAVGVAEGKARDVTALFAEVSVPLAAPSENSKGAPVLEFNLAIRAEEYSDFGSTSNPKASLRWQLPTPIPVVARFSYGTSFKAPHLSQLLESGVSLGEMVLMDPLGGEVEAVVVHGTNPDLRPEEASYSNVGLVVSPLDNARDRLTLAVDLFRVKQRDVIIEPTAQDVLSGVSPGAVDRTPGLAPQMYGIDAELVVYARLVNGGDRNTEGVDFNASWERRTEQSGNWTFALSTSRLLKRYEDIGDGRGDVDYAGFTPYPEWRGNLVVDWNRGAWRAGWVNRYIGGFDGVVPGMDSAKVGSYALTSVSLSYDTSLSDHPWLRNSAWARGTVLKFGIDNLFDRDPVFVTYQNGYIPSLSDIMGRSYYISLRRKL